MAEVFKQHPADVLLDWVEEITQNGKDLTPWEDDFVESIGDQLARTSKVSQKQQEILERIYAEKTK